MATKILILAANPWDSRRLALDEEFRQIQQALDKAALKSQFELRLSSAIRSTDIQSELLNYKPDVVHFSGHGETDGLIFSDDKGNSRLINAAALTQLFSLFKDEIRCVLLNACYSEQQAEAIAAHIPYVIGMSTEIGDLAAEKFAKGFYEALFAGKNFAASYQFGCNAIALDDIPEANTPVLKQQALPVETKAFINPQQPDVLISVAFEDKPFAEELVQHLTAKLDQCLAQANAVAVQYFDSEKQLQNAATVLIINSHHYQQQSGQLQAIALQKSKERLFLVEKEACFRPQALQGLLPYRFYEDDPQQGIRSLTIQDKAYFLQVEQLAFELSNRLLQIKNQQQFLQQRETQKTPTIAEIMTESECDAFVFINAAPEDKLLAEQLKLFLDYHHFEYSLPLDSALQPTPAEMRQDLENNLLCCDALVVVYGQTSPVWLREQLLLCRRMQRKRDEAFKIIAIHNQLNTPKPEINISLSNMQVFHCPPESIETYLPKFMEALR